MIFIVETKGIERTLISALTGATDQLNAHKEAGEIFSLLTNEDFTDREALTVFLKMKEAYEAGKSIGYEEFSLSLVGTDLLQMFEEMANIPFDSRPKEYARKLKEASAQRQFGRAVELIKEAIGKGVPVQEAMGKHVLPLIESTNPLADRAAFEAQPMKQSAKELSEMYSRMKAGTWKDTNCVPAGFLEIDGVLRGGFKSSQLIIIGARPGTGKTALALQMAYNMAQRPERGKVLFVSLEMTQRELAARLVAHITGIGTPDCARNAAFLENRNPGALEKLENAAKELESLPLLTITQVQNIQSLCAEIRKQFKKEQKKIQCVFIDYLGLIPATEKKANSYEATTAISKTLKPLAKELGVPVVVLSQFSRGTEKEKRLPMVSDLRDSGQIEQDADVIFLLSDDLKESDIEKEERLNEFPGSEKILINLAKHRNGRRETFSALFTGRTFSFSNLKRSKK